jgi:hypothetical protein
MIAALAGRRSDSPAVRSRIGNALIAAGATTLVCGAAYGAGLLALEVAGEIGLRRCVVLPWAPEIVRERSLDAATAGWGPRFDALIAAVAAAGDLTVLDLPPSGANPSERTNEGILTRALALAAGSGASAAAFAVWDGPGEHRTGDTRHFVRTAQWLGMPVTTIPIR